MGLDGKRGGEVGTHPLALGPMQPAEGTGRVLVDRLQPGGPSAFCGGRTGGRRNGVYHDVD